MKLTSRPNATVSCYTTQVILKRHVSLSVCLFVCLSVCLPVCSSDCLLVCLYI